MKVLLILNHAPDYRETFLRQLGQRVELTVAAQPCEPDNLIPPESRESYSYIEIPPRKFLGLTWQSGIGKRLNLHEFDIICCNFNPRLAPWLIRFLASVRLRKKWIWWGKILGSHENPILNFVRRLTLPRAACCLVYSKPVANQIIRQYKVRHAISFNNTEVCEAEIQPPRFDKHSELRLLFVGRNQPRKRLDRLVELAARRPDTYVRLVGPGMEQLEIPQEPNASGKITTPGRCVGPDLVPHFDWADLVVCPGHAGLLVTNAARFGKGIALDSDSQHAPEYWLATEAEQPFIPFGDHKATDAFLDEIREHRELLEKWAAKLQKITREKYTVEHMVQVHCQAFSKVNS